MGIDVLNPSCREFFFGHFKTQDFFVLQKFSKINFFWSIFRDFTGSPQPGSGEAV
jgi:hypothetical protein